MTRGVKPSGSSAIRGQASYYKEGRLTANGEVFKKGGLTAAHRTLPFGTRVQVRNTRNGKAVVVRINDRGPAAWTGRVIDLSLGAARELDMVRSGVVVVEVSVLQSQAARGR